MPLSGQHRQSVDHRRRDQRHWTFAASPASGCVAMVSIGAFRVAMETWLQDGGKHPLAGHVGDAFATLKAEV